MNIKRVYFRLKLALQVAVFISVTLFLLMVTAGVMLYLFYHFKLFDAQSPILEFSITRENAVTSMFNMFLVLSSTLGIAVTSFMVFILLRPMRKISKAMKAVTQGDYSVRLELRGIDDVKEISRDFNTMVQELASTETMRSDFINHISHEFKTPITSILGFAKRLSDPAMSEEKKQKFTGIIIAESEQLAALATDVLNLSKYEALSIITDKQPCQLDEQIRKAVLLLEPKWTAKQLNIELELEEITFPGNANLLDAIWKNLIDNAVKYSLQGGAVKLYLTQQDDQALFIIQDDGLGMDQHTKPHILRICSRCCSAL